MKYILIISVLIISAVYFAGSRPKGTGMIIVEVTGFNSGRGQLKSHLFHERNAKDFPKKSDSHFVKRFNHYINPAKTRIIYDSIPYGTYALTVHHDEDSNEVMNRNFIGYPAEGFGLSNNPKIILSVPKFDECKFKVEKETTYVRIKLKFT